MKWLLPPILWMACILACILASIALAFFYTTPSILPSPLHFGAGLLVLSGLAITMIASREFDKVQTNFMTFGEPNTLVTTGLFAVSRNPMYLGFIVSLWGVGFLCNETLALVPVLIFFLASHFWYIPFEERMARATFGASYEAYAKHVRRWI